MKSCVVCVYALFKDVFSIEELGLNLSCLDVEDECMQ